jgi:hypothetical protein
MSLPRDAITTLDYETPAPRLRWRDVLIRYAPLLGWVVALALYPLFAFVVLDRMRSTSGSRDPYIDSLHWAVAARRRRREGRSRADPSRPNVVVAPVHRAVLCPPGDCRLHGEDLALLVSRGITRRCSGPAGGLSSSSFADESPAADRPYAFHLSHRCRRPCS